MTIREKTINLLVTGLLVAWGQNIFAAQSADSLELSRRSFLFSYGATVTGLAPGQGARVWIPVPQTTTQQTVELEGQELPAEPQFTVESKYKNKLLYLFAAADSQGKITIQMRYRVIRRATADEPGTRDDATDQLFLQADALVPVGGKPFSLLAGKSLPEDQTELAHALYDVVDDHMQYRKDKPGWGRGDAVWACDSGFGNCTDFHSLFISLARGENIPAKFEMGFAIPAAHGQGAIGGYHCWAWFKPQGKGWTPVDISQANQDPAQRGYLFGHLDANRVAFTVGRDLYLEPKQDGPPVNFLIYPYVEVDGKPYPAEKLLHHFSYEDQLAPSADIR